MQKPNRNAYDSVFKDLFDDPKNLLRLYQDLYPENKEVDEESIRNVTIIPILINSLQNDLSFQVGNEQIILIEEQTEWSQNIALRLFQYFSEHVKQFLEANELDVHQRKFIELPVPRFIVAYSGEDKDNISINLNDHFKGSSAISMEIEVFDPNTAPGILQEYLQFSKILKEQRAIHGNTIKAIKETIRISKEKGYLKDYLSKKEKEVETMLEQLFSQEKVDAFKVREAYKEGEETGRAKGKAEGIVEGEARILTKLILKNQARGMSPERIAEDLDCSLEFVREVMEHN